MSDEIFTIVREAVTIAKVQHVQTVAKLRLLLLGNGYEDEDIQAALLLIKQRNFPNLKEY